MQVTRLLDRPIIGPDSDPSIGVNIQGPSLIRVPKWVPDKLGAYYLYFADHKGTYIRLAYADVLTGPWSIHVPGSLSLAESRFPTAPPEPASGERRGDTVFGQGAAARSHSLLFEASTPHIASPDVHVDEDRQRIIMYFHGLASYGVQLTRAAVSRDGLQFAALEPTLGRTYFRAWAYGGYTYALAMPGQLYRSADGLSDFEPGPRLFDADMRHCAVLRRGDCLHIFWTQVGEAPERVRHSTIDLRPDWTAWRETGGEEVLRPERSWEGADAPLVPSIRSTAYGYVNQLRDPAIFEEDGATYLLYAVAGESGIAIARVTL